MLYSKLADSQLRINQKALRLQALTSLADSANNCSSNKPSSSTAPIHNLLHAVQSHNFHRRIWQQRKQLCLEAVDMLSEGLGKKVSDVMVS